MRSWILTMFVLVSGVTMAQSSGENVPLRVGLAQVDMTPPIGVPLAGYGGARRRIIPWDFFNLYEYATYLKPSKGKRDAIRAKAMVLRSGLEKMLFISADVVGVTAPFREDLLDHLAGIGFNDLNVFVSATHTHSGPGTLSQNPVWELIAMDEFVPEIYQGILANVVEAARAAQDSAEDADLYTTNFKAENLQMNRRGNEGHFDPIANLLLAKSRATDKWLGGIVNLPIHGTSLGLENRNFSADVNGEIERNFERVLNEKNGESNQSSTVLFINAAEGDVAPHENGEEEMVRIGASFGDQSKPALTHLRKLEPTWHVESAPVHVGKAAFNIKACVQDSTIRSFIFRRLGVQLSSWMPSVSRIWSVRLGDIQILTWPGEATTSMGDELKYIGSLGGAKESWVFGLTNDYLGYFTTRKEYEEGGYESCSSLYGVDGGQLILREHRSLIE